MCHIREMVFLPWREKENKGTRFPGAVKKTGVDLERGLPPSRSLLLFLFVFICL